MISKSLRRIARKVKSSRTRYAAIFAFLVFALVFGAVQASGPMRSPHPPRAPQHGGMWGMQMPKWGRWMPWVPMEPVPKIKIVAVVEDLFVIFETEDFPKEQDFAVTMGKMYTRGINGIEIGSFNSGDGSPQLLGAFIPSELYGLDRISIRAQTDHRYPYYAFNWFYNTTAISPEYTALEGMTAEEAKVQLEGHEGLTILEVPEEAASVEAAEAAPEGEEMSIAEIAVADGNFTTLVAALEAAGLVETLAGDGEFTVFAPTDDAFAALPEGTVESLLEDPEGALTDVLLYHVVDGAVPAETVVTLDSATTLQGDDVTISVTDDGVVLNDTVNVTATDIAAANGIIHVIDAVLIPPSGEEESAEGVGGAAAEEAMPAESELTGVAWQWTGFSDPVQGDLTIDTPEQYTVEFLPEGLVGVKADCNNGSGTYIADEEGGIDIAIGIVTAAACAPESLSDQFLQYLGEVAVYSFDDNGNLVLDLPADSGTLSFAAGGAEAPAEGEETEAPAEGEAAETPADESAAAAEGEAAASVTGTVTYVQRIALPDDAVVTVQIQDTSLADAPAVVMGEQVIETGGQQVPIPYEVAYNPDEIQDNHTYTMSARIEDSEGNLLFINDTAIPVITRDNPTEDVEILTVQVASGEETEAPAEVEEAETPAEGEAEAPAEGEAETTEEATSLTGVVWNWTEFSDPVQGVLPVENPEQYTVEFLEDGTVGIKADCNNGSGSYVADEEGSIDITVGAVTLALCTEDSLSDQFIQYLDAAAVYFFEDGDLLLDLPVDSGTLRFAAGEAAEAGATAKLASITSTVALQPAAGGDVEQVEEESPVPSFIICVVEQNETVSIVGENFPAEQTFAVKMGVAQTYQPMYKHPMPPKPMPHQGPMKPKMGSPMSQAGGMWMKPAPKVWIPYYEAGTLETGTDGNVVETFNIPAELKGAYKISIMMRTDHQFPYLSYNWFYNNDADVCNGENGND